MIDHTGILEQFIENYVKKIMDYLKKIKLLRIS